MIHLRGCWLANGSKRAEQREFESRREEICRRLTEEVVKEIEADPMLSFLVKREARLIQKQNYIQQGGN